MDTDWCLHCDRKTQDGGLFCSAACHDLYNHQELSSSRPSSLSLSELSDLDLAAPVPPPAYEGDLHAEEWAGKGASGVPAWAAQIPVGAPPQSYASSPSVPSPPSIRPRKSTSSARSTASSSGRASSSKAQPIASSSTLRPTLPVSLSARKIAPPRLFLGSSSPSHCRSHSSHDSSVCSPATASCTVLPHDSCPMLPSPSTPSPTKPILNNRMSIPSLTAQSATASLSSLATPHTASRPPSRPQSRPSSFHPCGSRPGSRPASAAVSIAGDEDEEDEESECTPESRPAKKTWYQAAMNKVSNGVRQWAAGERMYGHVPYSTAHVVTLPRSTARPPVHREEVEGVVQVEEREKPVPRAAAPPQPSTSQQHKPSAPIPKSQTRNPRAYPGVEPVSIFPLQDELMQRFETEKERAKERPRAQPQPVRMGRGLVHPRVASRMNLSQHFQAPLPTTVYESRAYAARGRPSVKQERKFASQSQIQVGEEDGQ